jgi:serine/threonine-protein kinase HipA
MEKRKKTRNDFIAAFRTLNLDPKQQENIFRKMMSAKDRWMDFIGISFLSDDFKERLMTIIEQRFKRII